MPYRINPPLLLPCHPESHRTADMVIFQDTAAHPLPAGNIPGRFDVVRIIRNLSHENNSGLFTESIVGDTVPFNLITVLL